MVCTVHGDNQACKQDDQSYISTRGPNRQNDSI